MTTPFFSVILPVYKVEKYLRQCVDSVLSQNYDNYEVILVDDGSPDSCPQICDDYASRFARVRTVHRENGGQSAARNSGLSACSASEDPHYVIYLDSDDYWEGTDALAHIADNISQHNSDVVIFGCYAYDENHKYIARGNYDLSYNGQSKQLIIDYLVSHNQFPVAAWNIAVKRQFLNQNNINFLVGITGEDYDWLIKVFYHAESVSLQNDTLCVHRQFVEGSITRTQSFNGLRGINYAIANWLTLEDNSNRAISTYLARVYLIALHIYSQQSRDNKTHVKKDLYANCIILYRSQKPIHKLIFILSKIVGLTPIATLITFVYNLTHK